MDVCLFILFKLIRVDSAFKSDSLHGPKKFKANKKRETGLSELSADVLLVAFVPLLANLS